MMAICWSCQKAAGDGVLCAACNAVQPADPRADYFRVLGAAREFVVDLTELERRYKETTKMLHPDRFARADARARRASLERSVQLNEAWRTVKDPVRRAEYLLSLHGLDIGEMAVGGRPDQAGAHATLPVPQVLLMEVLELREALAEAQANRDLREVEALMAKVRSRLDTVMDDVATGFAVSSPDLGTIAARLVTVRYYRRFLDEARLILEAEAADHGKGSDAS
jgi:molecular chaperone HscB